MVNRVCRLVCAYSIVIGESPLGDIYLPLGEVAELGSLVVDYVALLFVGIPDHVAKVMAAVVNVTVPDSAGWTLTKYVDRLKRCAYPIASSKEFLATTRSFGDNLSWASCNVVPGTLDMMMKCSLLGFVVADPRTWAYVCNKRGAWWHSDFVSNFRAFASLVALRLVVLRNLYVVAPLVTATRLTAAVVLTGL